MKFKGTCVKANIIKLLQQANEIVLSDQTFCAIFSYQTVNMSKNIVR